MGAIGQHQREGQKREADHHGGQHKGLRQRVGAVGGHRARGRIHEGGQFRPRATGKEQKQVHCDGDQGQAEHHAQEMARQRHVCAGGEQGAEPEGEQRFHCFPLVAREHEVEGGDRA